MTTEGLSVSGSLGRRVMVLLIVGILAGLVSTWGARTVAGAIESTKRAIEDRVDDRILAASQCVAPSDPKLAPNSRWRCGFSFLLLLCAAERIGTDQVPACEIVSTLVRVWPQSIAGASRRFSEIGKVDDQFVWIRSPVQRLAVAYYIAVNRQAGGETAAAERALSFLTPPGTILAGPFGKGGLRLRGEGWGDPESWGTWSVDARASLLPVTLRESEDSKDLILLADVLPFIPKTGQTQIVNVLANGIPVANWLFTADHSQRIEGAVIPRQLLKAQKAISVSFDIPNAATPSSFGISNDVRKLGVGFKQIAIKEIQLAPVSAQSFYVSMRSGASEDSYVAAGWLPPTEAGISAIDPTASLVIAAPAGRSSKAAIAIDANVPEGQDGSRRSISVSVNGDTLGRLEPGDASTTFQLPDASFSPGQTLLIEFKDAPEPAGEPLSIRPLSLVVKGIGVKSMP